MDSLTGRHGRRLKRTMRALGYPKSHELLTSWIDNLVPSKRKLRHGTVPEELKREAVVTVASGRLKSREAAAGLGVDSSVVRNWERQMLAGSKEPFVIQAPRRKRLTAGEEEAGAGSVTPDAITIHTKSRNGCVTVSKKTSAAPWRCSFQ